MLSVLPPFYNWSYIVLGTVEQWIGCSVNLRHGTPEQRAKAHGTVCQFAHFYGGLCAELEADAASQHFRFIIEDVEAGKINHEKLGERLDLAARSFREELQERHFFRVARGKREYYGADFGPMVAKSFPAASFDIGEANSCFALERYLSAILHMVRAVEVALHALATERGVTFPNGPLAWQDWQTIITDIASKVDTEAKKAGRGPRKDAFLGFYNGALTDLRALKDVYRNVRMHTRPGKKPPLEVEAKEAVEAGRRLMQLLATRLRQSGRPIKWKL